MWRRKGVVVSPPPTLINLILLTLRVCHCHFKVIDGFIIKFQSEALDNYYKNQTAISWSLAALLKIETLVHKESSCFIIRPNLVPSIRMNKFILASFLVRQLPTYLSTCITYILWKESHFLYNKKVLVTLYMCGNGIELALMYRRLRLARYQSAYYIQSCAK